MSDIEKDQRYRDNDPRGTGRILTVVGFEADQNDIRRTKAICVASGGREVSIDTRRMYTDEKLRKSGFSLVRETTE